MGLPWLIIIEKIVLTRCKMSPAFVSVFLACLLSQWKRFSASVTNESIDFCCRSHPLIPSHLPGFCDFSCLLSLLSACCPTSPLPSWTKLFNRTVYFLCVLIFHPNIDPFLIWFPPTTPRWTLWTFDMVHRSCLPVTFLCLLSSAVQLPHWVA